MEFLKKDLPGSRQEIEVTISVNEVEGRLQEALSFFQKDVSLQGFRQGHVPEDMVAQRVGKEQLFAKAVELSVQGAYRTLLQKENLEVLGEPEIRIASAEQGKPLVFSVFVSLFPAVLLPDYGEIAGRVEKKEVEVEKEELEKTLQWLQESRKQKDEGIPELTDEFAKSLGNFPSVEALRQSVKEGLLAEKKTQEKSRMRQEIVARIAKEANIEPPEVLVHKEQESMLLQMKQGVKDMLKKEFSEYLKEIQKTEEELKSSLLEQAKERICQFLVLDAIAKKEKISSTEKEVEQEAQKAQLQVKPGESQLDKKELFLYAEGVLRNEKTLQFLEGFTK